MVHILDTESGHALPEKASRVAEIIHDYDPNLELRWIPPRARTSFDAKPYAVYHNLQSHPEGGYFVFFLGEDEMDHRVLSRLWEAQSPGLLNRIEADEKAMEIMKMKQRMEENEEAAEFAKWAINAPKEVQHNGVRYR